LRKAISKTRNRVQTADRPTVPASLSYEDWLITRLKDPKEAAAYLEGVIEDGYLPAIMLALRQVAKSQGGIAKLARKAKLTREATYRMLSKTGNPELRSLTAILAAAGLRLAVVPKSSKAA
jgi:probable addiction module antidote protein